MQKKIENMSYLFLNWDGIYLTPKLFSNRMSGYGHCILNINGKLYILKPCIDDRLDDGQIMNSLVMTW